MRPVDTSNILFICGGAFAGLERIIGARGKGSGIGFGAEGRSPDERRAGAVLREVEPEDLLKFGLIPGIHRPAPGRGDARGPRRDGRLIEILTEPKNALVKQYQRMFEMEGASSTFTEDALRSIAKRAIQRKTGARGLRSIMEGDPARHHVRAAGLDGVDEVVVNREVAESRASPLMIYGERKGDERRLTGGWEAGRGRGRSGSAPISRGG